MTETFATGMNQTSNKTLPDSEDFQAAVLAPKKHWHEMSCEIDPLSLWWNCKCGYFKPLVLLNFKCVRPEH